MSTIFFIFNRIQFLNIIFAEPNCDDTSGNTKLSPDDAQYCADKIARDISALTPAHEQNKKELSNLNNKVSLLKKQIDLISSQLTKIKSDIDKRDKDLSKTKSIFEEKARNQYIELRKVSPTFFIFLSSETATNAFREISYKQRATENDRKIMVQYAEEINKLQSDKESMEKTKNSLASSKSQLDEKAKTLGIEVAKVESYLATLSARQQSFLAQKLESLGLSRSAYNMKGGCSSDIDPFKSPGFSPSFAFFSFGVPNRVGLNQYGAWGRAKANQNYDQILRAYYNFDDYQERNTTIKVNNGKGINQGSIIWTGSLEDYIKRIYEVPDSWADNDLAVLKAQAIAARSYVLAVTNNGASSVCASEYCQVFKTSPKGGNWETAVNTTSGKVMIQGGQPITAWFSATHGGYAYTSGDIGWSNKAWTKRLQDSTGGINSFSDLFNNAYDKNSPVFYCDWGSRIQYNKTAWLKSDEVADIANVILLAKADGSTQKHLSQTDKPNPDGVDTWDSGRVKNELSSRGITPFDNVSNITIGADFGSGRTTNITIDGRSFDGQDFKSYFNLRAPANIQIVGPLFNIEKR
ncbi:MAG: SpoIID/LytB domain-containing protein [Candidatus Woesebacteria bacterium]|nr:SpoIID/LytB domain-containing protein [Candidatus Woesebacteria bacterium]